MILSIACRPSSIGRGRHRAASAATRGRRWWTGSQTVSIGGVGLRTLSDEHTLQLLAVSVCGFHVVLVAGPAGRPARLFVDAADLAQLVAKARAGERTGDGRLVAARGTSAFELRVVVNRSRGIATVDIDGRQVVVEQRPVPRNDPGDRLVAVKSFEPLRLIGATIEVAVR